MGFLSEFQCDVAARCGDADLDEVPFVTLDPSVAKIEDRSTVESDHAGMADAHSTSVFGRQSCLFGQLEQMPDAIAVGLDSAVEELHDANLGAIGGGETWLEPLAVELIADTCRFPYGFGCRQQWGGPADLSLIHISEPTRQAEISYAV